MYQKYNIALIPDKQSAKFIAELSKKIRDEFGGFAVDNINKYAHITLYRAHFPINNFDKLIAHTEETKPKLENPIEIELNGLVFDKGYIFIDIKKSKTIQDLHNLALEKFSPIRDGYIAPKLQDIGFQKNLSEEEKANINKYGLIRASSLYNPHITLTKTDQTSVLKLNHLLPKKYTLIFDQICLCKGGKNGVCTDILI